MAKGLDKTGDDRRAFLRTSTLGLFVFQLNGCKQLLSPREAQEKGVDVEHFSKAEGETLAAFGEALVPGAKGEGLLHFVDANLSRPASESFLTVRYLDVMPPHRSFYKGGIAALEHAAQATFGKGFAMLGDTEARALISPMLGGGPKGWNGPAAPLFYLAVRSDAADLVYGTMGGFERMNIPYSAHIEPKSAW